jgi:hypothetical protein
MKALVLNALGRGFDFEDVEIASPTGREVLVDVQASGLCHTDFLFATHDIVPTPSVLGHEVAGIVVAIGRDVTQLRVGDHVVGSLAQSGGGCARCLSGRVIAYDSEDEAIRIANNSKYGLHAAVLGTDLQRARRVASQIRSGRVVINGMTDDPQAPWGGFKYSGVGREYGRYGIEAFLETRAILES